MEWPRCFRQVPQHFVELVTVEGDLIRVDRLQHRMEFPQRPVCDVPQPLVFGLEGVEVCPRPVSLRYEAFDRRT
jgi:hypothetical protein